MKRFLFIPPSIFLICVLVPLAIVALTGGVSPRNYTAGRDEISKPQHEEKKQTIISVYFKEEDIVREMEIEDYIKGVVAAEMPAAFEEEALKAQAVAARTYAVNRIKQKDSENRHKGAAVCTDYTHCKAYISEQSAKEKWGADGANENWTKIKRAVEDTAGLVITYEGNTISAVFHSTSSGKTEDSQDVWGGSFPYLKSVVSEGEEQSPRYESTEEFTLDEFKKRIFTFKPDISFSKSYSKWVSDIEHTQAGSVKTLKICGVEFKGTEIREIFGLRSANFSISMDGKKVYFKVKGYGHGVGMSQYGANYMAKQGASFKQILMKYYQGVEIVPMAQ